MRFPNWEVRNVCPIRTTRWGLLAAVALCFAPVGSGAVAGPADTVACGDAEIGTSRRCEGAVPPLTNDTKRESVRFGFVIEPKNAGFSLLDDGCSAGLTGAGGSTCSVVVKFAPLQAENSAQLKITQSVNEGPSTPYRTYQLKGTGTTPQLAISALAVQFDSQQVLTSSEPKGLTLTNSGEPAIEIKSVAAHGDFAVVETELPHALAKKNDFLVLKVRFKPEVVGYHSGFLEITTDPNAGTRYVTLGGAGVADACGKWSRCGIWSHCREVRIWIALGLAVLYWLLMVIERWNRVARPTRELLKAQIRSLQEEIAILPTDTTAPRNAGALVAKLQALLTEALNLLLGEAKKSGDVRRVPWSTVLFWSRGEESTGWGYVHEVDVHLAAILDDATVEARLVTEEQKLRAAKVDSLTVLADKIAAATRDGFKAELAVRRALLAEALNTNYDRGDSAFINMVSWQNKTSYLVVVGLGLLVVLTAAFGDQSILLLVGALGGFVSRLSRTLERNDVPTDYGASWTTLFLSPIAGALGAWAGVLLIELAAKWQVVGTAVAVDWNHAGTNAPTLAIALLFGFSERLLSGVLDALEKKTLENKAAAASGGSSTPTKTTGSPVSGSTAAVKGGALPDATIGQLYDAKLTATNVPSGSTWTLEQGKGLPDGLVFTPAGGIISQRPSAGVTQGTYTFRARVGSPPADPVYEFSINVRAAG